MPDEAAAAEQIGITVNQLRGLGRSGFFGPKWVPGLDVSAAALRAAREHLYKSPPPSDDSAPPAAAPARMRPIDRPTIPAAVAAGAPPLAEALPTPPAPEPARPRRGGRHGGGGDRIRTGREVEIPARAWVASVQRTDTQWHLLQRIVESRRRAGDDADQIRSQLTRAGVPAAVVDQLQPR